MVEETMAGIALNFNSEMRPFNDAFTDGKLPCPHRSCRSETGKAFFQDLAQHYRIKHRELAFNKEKHTQEARRLFNLFHGNETKQYLARVFSKRSLQVNIFGFNLIIIVGVSDHTVRLRNEYFMSLY
ncbi:Hypothetical predicted protein [Paramuricea clavata]|uniref:Uncharacterized protein n=1 Tax=Paramuricea clavata TaxID=317549 RepID=A0A7D9JFH4_PARCT|nr:Hypothetical predicted protein [Paramuricea clavata]